MKRSETTYPLMGIDLAGGLKNAWEKGWLDEFSNDHFLIKAIEKRLEYNSGTEQWYRVPLRCDYRCYIIIKPGGEGKVVDSLDVGACHRE